MFAILASVRHTQIVSVLPTLNDLYLVSRRRGMVPGYDVKIIPVNPLDFIQETQSCASAFFD